ncbi:hypothetical protein FO519_003709 [Halicephalobus sp. NKZ332]|nr:hypothetical protein FO519_003709 [Halicephalobus sp. NKZ332]
METFRVLQLAVATVLAGFTVTHTLTTPDPWIYTWLTGSASVLLFLNKGRCPYWRLASAVVIVLGFLESIFLAWSLYQVESGPLLGHNNSLPEGRNVLLTSLATAVTTSTRLRHPNLTGPTSYIRSLILLVALVGLIPVAGYSACFYSHSLPFCHLFH